MRKIFVIGIGVGDPDHMTIQAIKALNQADVFFIPDKGAEKAALRDLRTAICERFIENADYRTISVDVPQRTSSGDYLASVDEWHSRLADIYARLFEHELEENEIGAILVWGDPAIYDSTLRIIERIRIKGLALEIQVIPGISSVQVLAAKHRVVLNQIGESVLLTTGRKLAHGFPDEFGSVVVLLDGTQAFASLAEPDLDIFWGAYLGTDDEILISGRLADVKDKIEAARKLARQQHGWIMDTYLLRKSDRGRC
ncbi:precorrin-6A synthase (deacetylating) [Bradyrhizobium canariense]|uniref:Precorrin-6A synthase [deacetylating] n=1 Tax=Bradyrhizobium canariense TaxID=255045 RepID=A0A1H1X7R7_9BRAD|nr:precorrin-6A synthase (deacetylating) [Bradyrhizobium canariense]SDT05101.1 precorrin-6A synthase (deacetylating) [Bradyrhizobium canariense]